MKYFAQFYVKSVSKPVLIPMLGSDGVLPLDGRKTIDNMGNDIHEAIERMEALNLGILGYTIERSTNGMYSGSYPVYSKNFTKYPMAEACFTQ